MHSLYAQRLFNMFNVYNSMYICISHKTVVLSDLVTQIIECVVSCLLYRSRIHGVDDRFGLCGDWYVFPAGVITAI